MAARYQHLSPAFLSEAVGKLDAVFGSLNAENGEEWRHSGAGQKTLSDGIAVSDLKGKASRTGFEPVLPP
jgi:hypothetical protein